MVCYVRQRKRMHPRPGHPIFSSLPDKWWYRNLCPDAGCRLELLPSFQFGTCEFVWEKPISIIHRWRPFVLIAYRKHHATRFPSAENKPTFTFHLAILLRKNKEPTCRFGHTASAMAACESSSGPNLIPIGRLVKRHVILYGKWFWDWKFRYSLHRQFYGIFFWHVVQKRFAVKFTAQVFSIDCIDHSRTIFISKCAHFEAPWPIKHI